MKEKKDRVDDALHATRAAIDEGVVSGGGVALLNAKEMLLGKMPPFTNDDSDEELGVDILMNAIEKPFTQILLNAGITKYHSILSKVEADNDGTGFNIKTSSFVNMIKEGIIDPTKVTRTALENAVSVAGTMLITECTIVDKPSDTAAAADPMAMMGM